MPNKIRFTIALLLVLLFAGAGFAEKITPSKPLNGDGTSGSPFQITKAAELYWLATKVNGGDCNGEKGYGYCDAVLVKDICLNACKDGDKPVLTQIASLKEGEKISDLGFEQWTPIGSEEKPYSGTFDGNGHTIRGLYYDAGDFDETKQYTGLFGFVGSTGVVENLGLVDSYISGYTVTGGVVGYNYGKVLNVYNMGAVKGYSFVGGVVGSNSFDANGIPCKVSNVYNTGAVSGNSYVGGVVGSNDGGSFENAYYNSDFISYKAVGAEKLSESFDIEGKAYGMTTAELANGTLPKGFDEGVWGAGSYDAKSFVYYLPYLTAFENGTRPSFVDKPIVTVANDDVYFKTEDVTGDDFNVTGSFGEGSLKKDNSLFSFTKSTWGDNGVVKGTYGNVDFTVTAPAVVISSGNKKAVAFGSSKQKVNFPTDVEVLGEVSLRRSFPNYDGNNTAFSTVMLPFKPKFDGVLDTINGVRFFEFEELVNGQVKAHGVKQMELQPNTPYLIRVNGGSSEIKFGKGGTFNTLEGGVCNEETGMYETPFGDSWKIYGTYEYKAWDVNNSGAYGFGANDGKNKPSVVGQFKKIGAGSFIYPMRVYLQYTSAKAVRAAPKGKAPKETLASLPENVDVVIEDSDAKDSSEKTTVIGTINTRTGEFKAANDRYFDLNGRNVGKKPAAKGSFYNK